MGKKYATQRITMAFIWHKLLGVHSIYQSIQILDMVLGTNFRLCTHCSFMILIGSVQKIGTLEDIVQIITVIVSNRAVSKQEGLEIRGCQYYLVGRICLTLPLVEIGLIDLQKSEGAMCGTPGTTPLNSTHHCGR